MKILLSAVNAPGAWLIRFCTFGKFSHCDVFLDDETLMGAHMIGGVKKQAFKERLHQCSRVAIYRIEATPAEEAKVLAAAYSTEGARYDWLAIVGWFFRQNWDSRARWFCSEWLIWIFRAADIYIVAALAKVKRIVPQDIEISPLPQLVVYLKGKNSIRLWAQENGFG